MLRSFFVLRLHFACSLSYASAQVGLHSWHGGVATREKNILSRSGIWLWLDEPMT